MTEPVFTFKEDEWVLPELETFFAASERQKKFDEIAVRHELTPVQTNEFLSGVRMIALGKISDDDLASWLEDNAGIPFEKALDVQGDAFADVLADATELLEEQQKIYKDLHADEFLPPLPPAVDPIEVMARGIVEKSGYAPSDHVLRRRFETIVTAQLKGIHDENATKEMLEKPVKTGGSEFSPEQSAAVIALLHEAAPKLPALKEEAIKNAKEREERERQTKERFLQKTKELAGRFGRKVSLAASPTPSSIVIPASEPESRIVKEEVKKPVVVPPPKPPQPATPPSPVTLPALSSVIPASPAPVVPSVTSVIPATTSLVIPGLTRNMSFRPPSRNPEKKAVPPPKPVTPPSVIPAPAPGPKTVVIPPSTSSITPTPLSSVIPAPEPESRKKIVPSATPYDTAADEAIAASGIVVKDDDERRRFRMLVSMYFRDLRDVLETTSKLTMPIASGGMGVSDADAEKAMVVFKEKNAAYHAKDVRRVANEKAEYVAVRTAKMMNEADEQQQKEKAANDSAFAKLVTKVSGAAQTTPQKSLSETPPAEPRVIAVTSPAAPQEKAPAPPNLPVAPIAKNEPQPVAPKPVASAPVPRATPAAAPTVTPPAQTISDVKFTPRLTGPVEELRALTLKDFRRLSKDPREATLKIKDKIDLLDDLGFEIKTQGIKAWQDSEVNKLYLSMLRGGLEGKPILDVIAELEKKREPALNKDEFAAIMELNRTVRFG